MALLWSSRALLDHVGKSLLEARDLELLHGAILSACDMNDGVKDGLIGDPRLCKFDPQKLLCTTESSTGCLTETQIAAIKKIYSGPVDSRGIPTYTSVAMKGSELLWRSPSLFTTFGREFANDEFRYSGFWPNPGPSWESADFDFNRDYKRFGITSALFSPVNPDLRKFKAAGGKLIAYQGWNGYMPLHMVDYYETTERTMGGRTSTQDFFRLFMIPGMEHCSGGDGAYAVDWLTYLETWVETGAAPNQVLSAHLRNTPTHDTKRIRFPLSQEAVSFSRPVYPYPLRAIYAGFGDPNDAKNFTPSSE
jgi:feruloyl esterase